MSGLPCPDCDGQGWVVGEDLGCCRDFLPSGECCAAIYGAANLVPEQVQEQCPRCHGTGLVGGPEAELVAALGDRVAWGRPDAAGVYHPTARTLAAPAPALPTLDSAWAEAEAALPEGWVLGGVTRSNGAYKAFAAHPVQSGIHEYGHPTPAAALRALADRLATLEDLR